jgi:hypothetical protein
MLCVVMQSVMLCHFAQYSYVQYHYAQHHYFDYHDAEPCFAQCGMLGVVSLDS